MRTLPEHLRTDHVLSQNNATILLRRFSPLSSGCHELALLVCGVTPPMRNVPDPSLSLA